MAIEDITEAMNTYRECARNLWNIYFRGRANIGASLDAFEQIRNILFDSLVVSQLFYGEDNEDHDVPPVVLRVVPRPRSLILIERPSGLGEAGYWDQEKDMVVYPADIDLEFVDYFDFAQVPVRDFHFYLCKIIRFPSRAEYEGRKALIEALDGRVFYHDGTG